MTFQTEQLAFSAERALPDDDLERDATDRERQSVDRPRASWAALRLGVGACPNASPVLGHSIWNLPEIIPARATRSDLSELDVLGRRQYIAPDPQPALTVGFPARQEYPPNNRAIEPACRLISQTRVGRLRAVRFTKSLVVRRRTDVDPYKHGFQPVQIPAGSALGDRQGHLAHPPRNHDHHHYGVRDGRACLDFLFRRGSDHPRFHHHRAGHPLMTTAIDTAEKRWYIVHSYSNFEKKVAESIREQAK